MPTYEYACKQCGEHLEVVQSFKDDPLTVCPNCGGDLRKVFGSVGIVFKGSGFYKTDSRSSSSAAKKTDAGTEAKETASASTKSDSGSPNSSAGSSTGSSSGGGSTSSDSKPAAAAG
jgi:putative FmdB family regulatory protein